MKVKKLQLISTILGGAINAILATIKLYIGLLSNSICILSDAINNFCDMFGFIGASISVGISDKKPTNNYPYGFGRVENITTLLISVIILVVGGLFFYESLERVFYHPPITFSWTHFSILIVTMAIKIGLTLFFHFVDKKSPSSIMKIEKLDCLLDTAITAMTIISFALARYTSIPLDGIIGVTISIAIIIIGIKQIAINFDALIGTKESALEKKVNDVVVTNSQEFVKSEIKIFNYGKNAVYAAIRVFAKNVNLNKIINDLKLLGIDSTVEIRGEL